MSNRNVIRVRPAAVTDGRNAKSLAKTYYLPSDGLISAETGERRIFFELRLPDFKGTAFLAIDDELLEPAQGWRYLNQKGYRRFVWKKPTPGHATTEANFSICLESCTGHSARHDTKLLIAPVAIEKLPNLLIEDLVYQLQFDWKKKPKIRSVGVSDPIDLPRLSSWQTLLNNLPNVISLLREIASKPYRVLTQSHHISKFDYNLRMDTRSYRWLAQKGLLPMAAMTLGVTLPVTLSKPISDCDENHFVADVLRLTVQMLRTLETVFEGEKQKNVESHFAAIARSGRSRQKRHLLEARKIEQEQDELKQWQEKRLKFLSDCSQIQNLPFYRHLSNLSRAELPIAPSQVLTEHHAYRRVFEFHNELMISNRVDGLLRTAMMRTRLLRTSQADPHEIYENWVLVRLFRDLEALGFEAQPEHDLESMLVGTRLAPKLYSGKDRWLEFRKELRASTQLMLRVYHERPFFDGSTESRMPDTLGFAWKPDVTLEIAYLGQISLLFLDAKFKDYAGSDESQLSKDLFQVEGSEYLSGGIEKYLQIPNAKASFILHPFTQPELANFGARRPTRNLSEIPEQVAACKSGFELGYLPYLPQQSTSLRHWLGLMLTIHCNFDEYCWNCHHTEVRVQKKRHLSFTCPNCLSEWQRIRCKHCGSDRIFGGEEAPFNLSYRTKGYFCPECGRQSK